MSDVTPDIGRYPQWRIDAWTRAMREEFEKRAEAYAIKRAAERAAGER